MSNTIEEAAREYVEHMCPIGNYCGDVHDEQRHFEMSIYLNNAKDVLEWLYQQPLASRLTYEEKERVRKMYSKAQGWLDEKTSFENPNEQLRICAVAIQDRLERIFGAELFKEGE